MAEEKAARAATFEDLLRVIKALNDEGAEYLLIGGYALYAHGYQRATTDVDILVPPTRESTERVIRALLLLPDRVATDIDPSWFEEGNTIRVADEFVVDVMFNSCGESYTSLLPHAQTVMLDDGTPSGRWTSRDCLRPTDGAQQGCRRSSGARTRARRNEDGAEQ